MLFPYVIAPLSYDLEHPETSVISLWNFFSHPISHPVTSKYTLKKQAISRWENEGGKID
jgi:hypothetical protein